MIELHWRSLASGLPKGKGEKVTEIILFSCPQALDTAVQVFPRHSEMKVADKGLAG
jgi:hypothetical protein